MGIVERYFLQLNTEKQRLRRLTAVLTALSVLVVAAVAWNLRLTGITMANDACCGYEEHQHSEECPVEKLLICGYTEASSGETPTEEPVETPAVEPDEIPGEEAAESGEAEPQPSPEPTQSPAETASASSSSGSASAETAHVHTDDCYELRYGCGFEEHIHSISCYSDISADLETADVWDTTLPGLTGNWANDLASVARSQLGNGESESNFQLAEDGQTRNGITRYGQWYGNPYADWSSIFTMFCLNYAGIPQDAIAWSPGAQNMMLMAQDKGILNQPDASMAAVGNILFIDIDGNGNADKSLIVTSASAGTMNAIGGDWDNTVCEVSLSADASNILGYINVAAVQSPPVNEAPETTEERTESAEESEAIEEESTESTTDPTITVSVEFPEEGIMQLIAQTANIDDAMFAWQWQVSEDGNEPWTNIEGAEAFICELADTEENYIKYYRLQGHKLQQMTFALVRAATADEESGTISSDAISPFSIGKDWRNNYTVDCYAIPVDLDGNRIENIVVTSLGSITVNRTNRTNVESLFDTDLGQYQSAYFGSETTVDVNNIASVWRYRNGSTYYLAYAQTNGAVNQRYMSNADSRISLYLRYIPEFTVSFASDGASTLTENVVYGNCPTLTEPGEWTRDGYTLVGWIVDGNEQTVYTYEQIMQRPVTADVTYSAKWRNIVTVSFDTGQYADSLYPIEAQTVPYGSTISQYPSPVWESNADAVVFGGWYLDEACTEPVAADYVFYEDTTLYAKWLPREDGYFVYYMDFNREGETPLVLMTSGVAEGRTVYPITPTNAPEGMGWDGKWYLDAQCTEVYDFSIPVSDMTDRLTGANNRDLYLYPGMQAVCRAIFVTYGTRIDPVTVPLGGTLNLDQYIPQRYGYAFAGWTLKDGTPVSGEQVLNETTTYYATWEAGYVPFEAVLRIENANDTEMTQADILGTWYAKAGSQIRVNSTYTGSGSNRTGTHYVVCVLDGVEYPVYSDAALTRQATLADVYSTYYLYNNSGTEWTDEVNWDDVYTGGELPYSSRPISSAGDTIINFDYMRVRRDIVFNIPNSRAYIDVYKLYQEGLITGSVTYTGTTPSSTGRNASATGVSGTNVSWTYTAVTSGDNLYTLHDIKYGQRIYEVYPVGGSWLTVGNTAFRYYETGNGDNFASRREDASAAFFTENTSGRRITITSFDAVFQNQSKIALMYAIECLAGETADFTIDNVGYKVQTHLCEVVNSGTDFNAKELLGCVSIGEYTYSNLSTTNSTLGGTSVRTLFGTTYWQYYDIYDGIDSLSNITRAYIFPYDRLHLKIQFSFAYDSDGDGSNETLTYEDIAFGERLEQYQYGMPNFAEHPLLEREGYEFVGWLDANGFVLEEEDWKGIAAHESGEDGAMIFIAKWEKVSNNIVEYYEDVSAAAPFEIHYFDDGDFLEYPTMAAYPQSWVWQEQGEGSYQRFDWDVPMYGEYGVEEVREINGEERKVNVIRIYGKWDESHTRVVYDPNSPNGGVPGTAPVDSNEYTIWQSEVSVLSQGSTANMDPEMVFAGWLLDRNGVVYQPGDHVPVQWPRTMIFTAQWAKPDEIVHLRYDPNGGTPDSCYPSDAGFDYPKNATALVWNNALSDGSTWYQRIGYSFIGWNTQPDGSGTSYQYGSNITLVEPMTTLYAQWRRDSHSFDLIKQDRVSGSPLSGAEFDLYRYENGQYLLVEQQQSGNDGRISFTPVETAVRYKLVESKPPDGYSIITREIYFGLSPGANFVSLEFYDSSGNVIAAPSGVTGEYVSGTGHLMLTVDNVAGFELPATGGIGTPLYMLSGALLMIAPFVYGFRTRRKHERRAES